MKAQDMWCCTNMPANETKLTNRKKNKVVRESNNGKGNTRMKRIILYQFCSYNLIQVKKKK